MNKEIIEGDQLCKKFKRGAPALTYLEHGLLAGTIIYTSGGLASTSTGIEIPAAIALGSLSLFSVITQRVLNKTCQIHMKKARKHHHIQLAAQTILDGISILFSKVIEDSHISQNELCKKNNAT